MADKKTYPEIVFLVSHPSDLNLSFKIMKFLVNKNFLILVQNNRFSSKISMTLEKRSIKNYEILLKEIRYGKINVLQNLKDSFKLKRYLMRYKNSKLIIFDKSQLISNIAISCFKKYLIVSYFTKDTNKKKIDVKLSIITLLYSFFLFLRPVLSYNTKKGFNINTQARPEYKNILYWNGPGPVNKKISFPTKIIVSNNEIIIFGSRFTEWQIDKRQKIIEEILFFYREVFKNFPKSSYLYCPHPRESKNEFEILKGIFGDSLLLMNNYISAEDLLENKDANKFCISISSAASKSAYLMGFKSYIFVNKINFEHEFRQTMQSVHTDLCDQYFNPPKSENDLIEYSVHYDSGDLKKLYAFLK